MVGIAWNERSRLAVPRKAEMWRRWRGAQGIAPVLELVERRFAKGPDRLWHCDITYLPATEGFLHFSTIMDARCRSIVGWSMGDTLHVERPVAALQMAVKARSPRADGSLSQQGEHGVQYACHAYRSLLAAHGLRQSMSHARDCYDNAMAASLFSTLKRELPYHETSATRVQARAAVFQWMTTNCRRTCLPAHRATSAPRSSRKGTAG